MTSPYQNHALWDEDVGEGVLVVLGDAEDVFAVPLEVVGDVDAAAEVQTGHGALLGGVLKNKDIFRIYHIVQNYSYKRSELKQ